MLARHVTRQAFDNVKTLVLAEEGTGGADAAANMHPALVKFWQQRCAYDQLIVDALLATLHNSLRILCCCGEHGLAHIERRFDKAAAGTASSTDLVISSFASPSVSLMPASTSAVWAHPYAAASPIRGAERAPGMGYAMVPTPQRVVKCNLMTLTKAIDVAGSFLHFLLQVEACAEERLNSSAQRGAGDESEWLQEHSALVHRRKMLLRVAECASILLG
jgi:hypothetical protein